MTSLPAAAQPQYLALSLPFRLLLHLPQNVIIEPRRAQQIESCASL